MNNVFNNNNNNNNSNSIDPKQKETLFNRLARIFQRSKIVDKEITPQTVQKEELPTETGREDLLYKSFDQVISGYVSEARSLEEDRYIRYRDYEQMSYNPVINGALELYCDESVQKNEKGELLIIKAKDKKTEKMVKELFYDKLKIQDMLWKITYEMCKYGDAFYEIVFNKKLDDILYLKYVSPFRLHRIDENGKLKGYVYIVGDKNIMISREQEAIKNIMRDEKVYDPKSLINPYKIVQWKIDDNKFYPYGRSILDSSRIAWKQMKLLEDAVIVYRLARSPVRLVWKIETGMLSPDKSLAYVTKIKNMVRKKPIIDPITGSVTDQVKAISMVEDYWLPVRQGQTSTSIEELGGQQRLGEIDDLQYWKEQILFNLRIPKAFVSDESIQMSGKTLSQSDVFFARTVERIQTHIEHGLYKIAFIYLILKKVSPDKIKSLKIKLTPASMYKEIAKIEFLNSKYGLIQTISQLQMFPSVYIMKEFLQLSDEEILAITGLMQAQAAGADIIGILTGETSPFVISPQDQQQQQQPVPQTPEQIGAEMEKELGAPPTPPEETITPPEETTAPEIPTEKTPPEISSKIPSPTELALKALMNLESVKNKFPGQKEKLLTEISQFLKNNKKTVENKTRRLLNILETKNEYEEDETNGFSNLIATGELSGLLETIKQKEKENELITENQNNRNNTIFLEKIKKKEKEKEKISKDPQSYLF